MLMAIRYRLNIVLQLLAWVAAIATAVLVVVMVAKCGSTWRTWTPLLGMVYLSYFTCRRAYGISANLGPSRIDQSSPVWMRRVALAMAFILWLMFLQLSIAAC
jgi:hypothetical protein